MSLAGFTRDAERVKANLVELEDHSVVCKRPCKIIIPARYEERSLASLGSETYILGIWALIVDDVYYGISMTNAMMRIDPVSSQTIRMDGDDYMEFSFDAGSRVFVTTNLLKTKAITYQVFDEFFSKGNVPWFLEYEDLAHIYQSAPLHAGKTIGGDPAIFDMIVATIARDPKNRRLYYRHNAHTHQDQFTNPPDIVPFNSVIYNATDTTAALLGSHASDGLISALVNPSTRIQKIEELLRR